MEELTDKQQRFIEEYCVDWNATQAAIRAGYSEKGAQQEGSRLLLNVVIQSEIKKNMSKHSLATGANVLRNLRSLASIAYSNIADIYQNWETLRSFDDLPEDQKAAISEIHYEDIETKNGHRKIIKIKLHSKISAIQELNKMLGGYEPDRLDITSGGEKISQMRPIYLGINPHREKTITTPKTD